jgi:hypothetical protein
LHHPDSQLQSQINEMKDKVEQLLLWLINSSKFSDILMTLSIIILL